MNHNNIGDGAAEKIAETLPHLLHLRDLFLDPNKIGNEGARRIGGATELLGPGSIPLDMFTFAVQCPTLTQDMLLLPAAWQGHPRRQSERSGNGWGISPRGTGYCNENG
eukprot:550212-Rhodomonas_salina.1